MRPGSEIANEATRLDRARRLLRGQLEALAALAAIALRMVEGAAAFTFDRARPLAGASALERAVRRHARVAWALRLISALRAKLVGDLERVERGEGVDDILAAEVHPALAAEADIDPIEIERAEPRRETECAESENFGRWLSRRTGEAEFADILKRPTEEVIALIREALGLDGTGPKASADLRFERGRGQGRPHPIHIARPPAAHPPPHPPQPRLRSPCTP